MRSRSTWPARTKASTRARSRLGGLAGACGVVVLCERISDGRGEGEACSECRGCADGEESSARDV